MEDCFECGGDIMEDDKIPPLTPDSTSSISDEEHEYGSLREEMTPKLCLPLTVDPICLDNEISATNDDRYTFEQIPI